jgi:hypothetical protein
LPFFAKLHRRKDIAAEVARYREFVAGFIPGHLHPRIDERRCVEGATESLLVGGFVESSESLINAVVRGMGEGPLQSLCTQTLRGWHMQGFAGELRQAPLITSLDLWFPEFRSELVAAARAMGLREHPNELVAQLRARPATTHSVGPIHGDLHARNVQVRNGEAILIDFRSTRIGPVVADLASLEVSIAFDCYGPGSTQATWSKIVDELYGKALVDRAPKPLLNQCAEVWLWNAVRYIRQQASFLATQAHEYREILAMYLLRRACFRVEKERPGDEYRRAYALVTAAKVVRSLTEAK